VPLSGRTSPAAARLLLAFFTGILSTAIAGAALKLPPIPSDHNFVQDGAALLPESAEQEIGLYQERAFRDHQTPIIVVTIPSMADYGGSGYSIERFAAEWFNHWQIGYRGEGDQLMNRGILLLVSRDDRKARIELGADWGLRWDSHCNRIMQNQIVPRFKQGDYPSGVIDGVGALAQMAALGPEAEPPGRSWSSPSDAMQEKPLATSPLPLWAILLSAVAGIGCIVASFFMPEHRKLLLIAGIVLLLAAFMFWILLIILAIINKFSGRSGGGGFSSSGGFGSGGFSGGGGASGSW
jgi:uncharacterized protein